MSCDREAAIPAPTVHPKRFAREAVETLRHEVLADVHRTDDAREREHLDLLTAHQGVSFEEGNHLLEEIPPPPDDQHVRVVARASVVFPNRTAADPLPHQIKDLGSGSVLTDTGLRDELPSAPRAGVPLQCDVEAAFSVNEARDVGVQSFLLIDRT